MLRLFLLLPLICSPCFAQDVNNIIYFNNIDGRKTQDLSGSWHYSIDPYRVGQIGFHGTKAGDNALRYRDVNIDDEIAKNPKTFFEQDMDKAPLMNLPGAWNSLKTELRYYDGLVWYRKNFKNIANKNERAFLHFDGANYLVKAYINGHLIGAHEGGFTAFSFEITDYLKPNDNKIDLEIDCKHDEQSIPTPITDWDLYCGITRPVKIIYTPNDFIENTKIAYKNGKFFGEFKVNSKTSKPQNFNININELNQKYSGKIENNIGKFEFEAPKNLILWSPENPKLYKINFAMGGDKINDDIGFRTIEAKNNQIYLNDKPLYLRGISMHEEEIGKNPSRNMTSVESKKLFNIVKNQMHGNFVRLSHYPHTESTLKLADKMGLLVWSEIPVYWTIDFNSQKTRELAKNMLSENIARDYNRASIIIWSVGNETPISPIRNEFMGQLIDETHRLDNSRLVSAALMASRNDKQIIVDDPLGAKVDLLAVNTYNGWYSEDDLKDLTSFKWQNIWNKPMIFSEFGADAKYGFHDKSRKLKFSEEYQEDYFKYTLKMAQNIPFLVGLSPWVLKDFRSPRRQHPIYQQGWNRKGLISETGEKKKAFETLSGFYKSTKQ